MKVDYKPTFKQFRFPFRFRLQYTRTTVRLILTAMATVCLIVGILAPRSGRDLSTETITQVTQLNQSNTPTTAVSALPNQNDVTGFSSFASNSHGVTSSNTQTSALTQPMQPFSSTLMEANATQNSTPSLSPKIIATTTAPDHLAPTLPNTAKLEPAQEKLKQELTKPTWRTIKIQKGDTLAKIFKRHGYPKQDLSAVLKASAASKKYLTALHPRKTLKILTNDEKKIHGLSIDTVPGNTLALTRKEAHGKKPLTFLAETIEATVKKQLAFGKGLIKTGSLISAGKRAGLDHNIVSQMVNIFGFSHHPSSKLKPNDSFRVLFEEKRLLDGERIGTGTVLAAEIVNNGKKHVAIRYTDKSGRTGYFSPEGYGMHQTFLTPVNFTRISSAFGRRTHPIYHRMREHKGIDYSAPAGTPVQATADAKVTFIGTRGGYGKVIELQHGARYSTLYAHLSRFEKKISTGTEVKQGQIIGYVGRTGLATGDHLHYEFRIDGIHRDPLSTGLLRKSPISDSNKHHFLAHAKEIIRLMDHYENKVNVARSNYP